jgi:hypothetical protein
MKGKKAMTVIDEMEKLLKGKAGKTLLDFDSVNDAKHHIDRIDMMRPPTVRPDVKRFSRLLWMEVIVGVLQLTTSAGTLELRENALGTFEIFQSHHGARVLRDTASSLAEALHKADEMVPRESLGIQLANAAWRRQPPTEAQCGRLRKEDPDIRRQFKSGEAFYLYATRQYENGNLAFSKGGISALIDKHIISKGNQP